MIQLKADEPVLFLDLQEVEQLRGIQACLAKAQKYEGNPVVRVGKVDAPDALQVVWPFAVLFDRKDQLFKMWYSATGHLRTFPWNTAYAYSEDGIEWIKPDLGLFEYGGSKHNNLVYMSGGGGNIPHAVFIDPEEQDPKKRFKALLSEIKGKVGDAVNRASMGKVLLTSPDGVHWSREEGPYLLEDLWPPLIEPRPAVCRPMHWMDVHQLMYDAYDPNPQHRYKMYGQTFSRKTPDQGPYRNISIATGPGFERFVCYAGNPILDIERENEIHFATVHRTAGYYVMLHEYAFFEPIDGRYTGDIRISVSRDGFEFQRAFPREPLVARGEASHWDNCSIVTPSDIIEKDDKLWIYYAAASEKWNNWPQRVPKGFPLSSGEVQPSEIGLAWLRADGFTYLTIDDAILPGELTTVPMALPEKERLQLVVGIDKTQTRRNWLEVEILDAESGDPIPGYARADCERCTKDGLRVPIRWKHGRDIAELAGRTVKFRFFLNGKIMFYSFRVL